MASVNEVASTTTDPAAVLAEGDKVVTVYGPNADVNAGKIGTITKIDAYVANVVFDGVGHCYGVSALRPAPK